MKDILLIPKNFLVLMAGFVWMYAGRMVLGIGYPHFIKEFSPLVLLSGIGVFCIFFFIIFNKSYKKQINRIKNKYEERAYIWQFFDVPSYIIMFVMITFGVTLRNSGLLSSEAIAAMYSGIGSALFLSGLRYILAFFRKKVINNEDNVVNQ